MLFENGTQFFNQVNKARETYINYEKKNLEDQIQDLTQTISINKQMIQELFSTNDKAKIMKALNDENNYLSQKLHETYKENRNLAS